MSVLRRVWDWQHEIFVENVVERLAELNWGKILSRTLPTLMVTDRRIATYPFFGPPLQGPWGVMGILFLYLYFIKSFGPRFMEGRKPYQLKKVMIVYNFAQVLFSAFTFHEAVAAAWGGRYSWTCQPLDPEDMAPEDLRVARGCFLYFCCKLLDLLDTVFIVLRKNYRQLSFLHTYHHALMVVAVWGGAAYRPGGHFTFIGFLNTFVHTIMYAYYLLTAIDPKYKSYIGVKKWITRMQLAQFVGIFLHSAQVLFQPNCRVSRVVTVIAMSQAVLMIVLFSNFYYQTYIKRKTHKKE